MDSGAFAVAFDRVEAGYRGRRVLDRVTLRIPAGEIVGVYGPNGSGKTTLLRAIQALIPVTSGSASVCGIELKPANLRAVRRRTACVFQAPSVDRRLPISAGEVVMMGRYARLGLFRRPGAADWQIVRDCLERVDASPLARRPYGQLSGGEQQRINLARAIAQQPSLLLLDEPTTFLDAASQKRVGELIRDIHARESLTTVIVSHDSRVLAELCARIVVMRDGAVERTVSASEFADA